MLVMLGFSNAVNLTDGLDGLAIVPTIITAGVFALIAYLVGNRIFADYLQLNSVPGVGELAVFCSALIGAGLGFLWFNAPPAAVFMGDTGALALGGALGAVAVATKHEVVLGIVGGLFVLETVCVIVQVFWFKRTGRRVFLMAPLHHHFEKKGWAGSDHCHPLLDHFDHSRPDRAGDPENPMSKFPPDIFAGQRFAVLGLGRNGLPAAQALLAMGAGVVAWDDKPAPRSGRRRRHDRRRAGHDGARPHWCSRPAFRICCRRRTRSRRGRGRRRSDPVRRRAAVPRGARRRLGRALRRHHRHQRQIHHHRAAGAYPATGRPAGAAGGNLGTAALSLPLLPR